jgi:hypothetical protein
MLKETDKGNYQLAQEITAEEFAQLRLALHDVTMELLRAPNLTEDGKTGMHYVLLFFRPWMQDEIDKLAHEA